MDYRMVDDLKVFMYIIAYLCLIMLVLTAILNAFTPLNYLIISLITKKTESFSLLLGFDWLFLFLLVFVQWIAKIKIFNLEVIETFEYSCILIVLSYAIIAITLLLVRIFTKKLENILSVIPKK